MAKHDGKEHEHEERKRGGALEQPKEAAEADEVEERKRGGATKKEHEAKAHHARARGGSLPHEGDVAKIHERGHKKIHITPRKAVRKRGGAVEGKAAHHDMARRARGGATPEKSPISAAGHMENPPYVRDQQPSSAPKGHGGDISTHLGKA